jgi:hypothetical protein
MPSFTYLCEYGSEIRVGAESPEPLYIVAMTGPDSRLFALGIMSARNIWEHTFHMSSLDSVCATDPVIITPIESTTNTEWHLAWNIPLYHRHPNGI